MGTEGAFDLLSVYDLRTGPALRGAQDDHRPLRTLRILLISCVLLDCLDLLDDNVHGLCHLPVHSHRIVALNKVRLPAAALEEGLDLVMRDTGEDGRVADLISVQVQDRKNRTVSDRV